MLNMHEDKLEELNAEDFCLFASLIRIKSQI